MFEGRKKRKLDECEARYNETVTKWQGDVAAAKHSNKLVDAENRQNLAEWQRRCADWEKARSVTFQKVARYNKKIDKLKESYLQEEPDAIIEYCRLVLQHSLYPKTFPKRFELEYNPVSRIFIIEYQLPSVDDLPTLKEVKYIASRDEMTETHLAKTQLDKAYDSSMYQIALRTIHEVLEADSITAIAAVSFNGWVLSINQGTGKKENHCILSIQAKRDEFLDIDLSRIDPKTCFKNLKGVASSKLSSLTPIQPILQITKTDKRFVDGYAVVGSVDTSTNLAAMDWEDFEHLIRELFEKEFLSGGGEVKVTQASRDGGVDAVAFDPDPIRGGKIVIQAKRYTNTVGVSAVRDLYGTVVNEGATKGILVTTADYGSDAYHFAKDKPLTLLNGSNLLHLLQKHGHHARIDLKEAKRLTSQPNEEH